MNVSIALLTRNRPHLLRRTLASLPLAGYPYTLDVLDNGSTDKETEGIVQAVGGTTNTDGNTTAGHGMNLVIGMALAHKPDLVVFTADDYEYQQDWLDRLVAFWRGAPDDVAIASCDLELAYAWNTIRGTVEAGGEKALVRDSLPGANWTFRASDWPNIGPIAEKTGGEDLEICKRLIQSGRRLCALNLATHTGFKDSSWQNESWRYGKPVDLSRYGIREG